MTSGMIEIDTSVVCSAAVINFCFANYLTHRYSIVSFKYIQKTKNTGSRLNKNKIMSVDSLETIGI